MKHYTYTYTTNNKKWDLEPTPPYVETPTGLVPQFDCGDTMRFDIKEGDADGHHHHHHHYKLSFKKKEKPHCSDLPTPFAEFNGKDDHSPYPYKLKEVLTFAQNNPAPDAARWTFHLSPLDSSTNLDNDPELQVGTGRPGDGEGGH
jgi:hypothetical protein